MKNLIKASTIYLISAIGLNSLANDLSRADMTKNNNSVKIKYFNFEKSGQTQFTHFSELIDKEEVVDNDLINSGNWSVNIQTEQGILKIENEEFREILNSGNWTVNDIKKDNEK